MSGEQSKKLLTAENAEMNKRTHKKAARSEIAPGSHEAGWLGNHFDSALILRNSFQTNLEVALSLESGELFTPLEQKDTAAGHQIVQGQSVEFARSVDAIKVDVVETGRRAAVFVNQGESWTGDVFFRCGMKALRDALDQSGFSGAEIAGEYNQFRRRKQGNQFFADRYGFLGTLSYVFA